ncbi:monocarboxylate transporter 13-like [Anneissia japonica]|uniref:monocarboxylate transporter 13-like n=1 Tax=Anneissia japonica TaxID=1529436 RepID=UPI0014257781|nr:monocarboxylate transporter 13-like [Anneissia japonica]
MDDPVAANDLEKSTSSANTESRFSSKSSYSFQEWTNHRRGWTVTIGGFCTYFMMFGFVQSFGVFYTAFQEEFNSSAEATGWIGSLTFCLLCSLSPISSMLFETFNHRSVICTGVAICSVGILISSFAPSIGFLYFSFSVLVGTGVNFIYTPVQQLVTCYFSTNCCSRATSLVQAGATVGMLVMTPVFQCLLTSVGWRNALRIEAALMFIICSMCTMSFEAPLVISPPSGDDDSDNFIADAIKTRNKSPTNSLHKIVYMMRTINYWFFMSAIFFAYLAAAFISVYFVSIAESVGLSTEKAALLTSVLGSGELCGRIACAAFGDYLPFQRIYVLVVSSLIGTFSMIYATEIDTDSGMVAFAICIGFARSIIYTMPLSVAIETFGADKSTEACAHILLASGLSTIVIPFTGGKTYDVTSSYTLALWIHALFCFFATILFLAIPAYKRYQQRHEDKLTSLINQKADIFTISDTLQPIEDALPSLDVDVACGGDEVPLKDVQLVFLQDKVD